jgi:triacylglycerol lipase
MLARQQQLILLALSTAAAAWASYALMHGWLAAAVLGVLCIALGHAFVLAVEFIILRQVNKHDPTPRASSGTLLLAWACETIDALLVFCWQQPFRSKAEPDNLAPDAFGRRGVVLVHGFMCNRGLWNPWMRRLREQHVPFLAVNLEPAFGSIDTYGVIVGDAVQRLHRVSGEPPLIVAHSMGGLAVRVWLRRSCGVETAGTSRALVHSVITIGTPHRGTWLGRFACSTNAREMRLSSPWIAHLTQAWSEAGAVPFTCFYSQCDNIVFPASAGTLPGADNRHVPGAAHLQMVYRPEVFAEVLSRLQPA